MDNKRKEFYSFLDYSKTEEGRAIFEKNQALWKDGDYLAHVRSLTDPKEIEIGQLMRRYQSSFTWIRYIYSIVIIFKKKCRAYQSISDPPYVKLKFLR